jgi:hypothetical protein
MHDAATLSWEDRRQQLADAARRAAASAWLWGVVAVSLGALLWLFWPAP